MAASPSRQALDELARGLELEVCVARLLACLFPGAPATGEDDEAMPERAGRHRPLEAVIETDDALRGALLADDPPAVSTAWERCLVARAHDLDLMHDLAVLYRERALREGGRDDEHLAAATLLWALVLATRDVPGPPRERIAGELLDLHAAQGARALATGRTATARLHLRCLDACRTGPDAAAALLADLPSGLGVRYGPAADPVRFAGIARLADAALDHWSANLVEDAERAVNDPDAIDRLPQGIRADYESGIAALTPMVRLGVPTRPVLVAGIGWHNDWCYCLYSLKDFEALRRVLDSGGDFASRLAGFCVPGEGHRHENQALSIHHMFRGVVAPTDTEAVGDLEEALRWNPANHNAVDLLAQSLLKEGDVLAGQGRFAAALRKGERARELAPHNEQAASFVREMSGYSAEEGTYAAIRAAREHLTARSHDRALQALAAVPDTSRFATMVRQLRMEAHLGKGVTLANEGPRDSRRLGQAAAELRRALTLTDRDDDLDFVRRQLSTVLSGQAVSLVEEAAPPRGPAGGMPDVAAHALRLLDEALELDPSNASARRNHDDVRRLLGAR
ncbi:hypothetical protein [Actinomadura hibisca]|uniref:hypothetical protein n=1 Tax=Actinomadura hibisca TaxID=68565 RepID=UPI0008329730|nr:hypothetical protein [Actinomadura hibisca]